MRKFLILLLLLPGWSCATGAVNRTNPTEGSGWDAVPAILSRIVPPTFADRVFDVTTFGAVGNGLTDCSIPFARAINACNTGGGGRVLVPEGTYLTGPIRLKSNVELHVARGATIRFSTDPAKYLPVVRVKWEGVECNNYSPLIYAFGEKNIAVTGEGVLDGRASSTAWWNWSGKLKGIEGPDQRAGRARLFAMGEKGVPVDERNFGDGWYLRPNFFVPYNCTNVLVRGVTFKDSPMWFLHPVLCSNVSIIGVTITGQGPNNDGCDPESCTDVLIRDCRFDNGDDCIAIKSGRNNDGRRMNASARNIVIQNCTMRNGHGGVVLGSEISGGVQNVYAEGCAMDSPLLDRVLRIKTNSVRGGTIENIFMRNVTVGEVAEAVLKIDYFYEEGDAGEFAPVVRNIQMKEVTCEKSRFPLWVRAYRRSPATGIKVEDCTFAGVAEPNLLENVRDLSLLNTRVRMRGEKEPAAIDPAWPWSRRIAATFLKQHPDSITYSTDRQYRWHYEGGVMLEGMRRMWEHTKDTSYFSYIRKNTDFFVTPDGAIRTYEFETFNLDNIPPGRQLFTMFDATRDRRYLAAADLLRRQLREQPRTASGGFWHKKIYPNQMWLDGLYMAEPFYTRYSVLNGDSAGLEDVVRQFVLMEKGARDPQTGLLYHAWDESRSMKWADPVTGRSPHFWGRAMGWYGMALVDVLDILPQRHPGRPTLLGILNRLAEALLRYRDPETKLWFQVVDQGGRSGNYLEASASAMYTYVFARGASRGYLPSDYRLRAKESFAGIIANLVSIGEDGTVSLHQVCQVAGLGGNPYRDGSFAYYIGEPRRTNDFKGYGPFLFAAIELEGGK